MELYKKISVDLYNPYPLAILKAKQGDTARGAMITLTAGGAVLVPTTERVRTYAKKPDGTKLYNDCEIENGKVRLKFTNQLLAVPGQLPVEIEMTNGDAILSTPIFMIQVLPTNIDSQAVESSDEFTALQEALSQAEAYKTEYAKKPDAILDTEQESTEYSTGHLKFGGKKFYPETIGSQITDAGDAAIDFTEGNTYQKPVTGQSLGTIIGKTVGNVDGLRSDVDTFLTGSVTTIGDSVPVGTIMPYASENLPDNTYLFCDGSAVSRTTYSNLFQKIGTIYGAGDGNTTFNLPNLTGNVPVGYKSGDSDFGTLGKTVGEKSHALTSAENGPHQHHLLFNNTDMLYFNGNAYQAGTSMDGVNNMESNRNEFITAQSGNGQPHNNIQPSTVVKYIIKALPGQDKVIAVNQSELDGMQSQIGTLSSLSTAEKGSLVGAVNELDNKKAQIKYMKASLPINGGYTTVHAKSFDPSATYLICVDIIRGTSTYTEYAYINGTERVTDTSILVHFNGDVTAAEIQVTYI